MFRPSFGALPRPMKGASQPAAIFRHVWARLLSSQPSSRAIRTLGRAGQTPTATLSAGRRIGAIARPRLGTSQAIVRTPKRRGFRLSPWRRNKGSGQGAEENLSLSARFRKLSREYGRAAIAVYFLLSILDYPFFFMLVKAFGTERIGKIEHYIISTIASVVPQPVRQKARELWQSLRGKEEATGDKEIKATTEAVGRWGVEAAQERHAEEASLATQLTLAYAIHKTFFFVRVPLTIAVTPRIVKQLRSWGWNIGRKIVRRPARR